MPQSKSGGQFKSLCKIVNRRCIVAQHYEIHRPAEIIDSTRGMGGYVRVIIFDGTEMLVDILLTECYIIVRKLHQET